MTAVGRGTPSRSVTRPERVSPADGPTSRSASAPRRCMAVRSEERRVGKGRRTRRHTRSTRDWSSDVCSSDLLTGRHIRQGETAIRTGGRHAVQLGDQDDRCGKGYAVEVGDAAGESIAGRRADEQERQRAKEVHGCHHIRGRQRWQDAYLGAGGHRLEHPVLWAGRVLGPVGEMLLAPPGLIAPAPRLAVDVDGAAPSLAALPEQLLQLVVGRLVLGYPWVSLPATPRPPLPEGTAGVPA